MKTDIGKRSVGINFNVVGEAEIKVWSPLAKKVTLHAGEKELPLVQENYGYWKLTTNDIKTGDQYQFSIDENQPLPDPASLSQPDGVHGPSQAIDITAFNWTDKEWNNIALEQYILYELHTGTFTPQGTFSGIEEKLDHLLSLGVNAIEIMPVAQFPGSRNWGYDGVYPFAVQHSYGGAAGLQHLVNTCHQKGIAVVLDVVYNHLGPEGNYMGEYGPFFTDKYNTPWGKAINFDDAWCDGVRQYYIENALMWFRDFHIDALRLDAVHAIKDFSPVHILKEIKRCTETLKKQTGRQHYLIVESDLNDNRYINAVEKDGYGMDAQWIDEFHHALRIAAGGDRTGYYSDFDGVQHLAKAYKDAYVYDGQYSEHRHKFFGVKAGGNPGEQFIVFSQNHDQVGNRMLGERTSTLASFEMQKLLAGAVLVSPYLPMLFMGEEWSEPNPFIYFVSHTDEALAEAVRKGRKAEFAAFHAEGEAPDPVAEETFNGSKLQWDIVSHQPHATMLAYYQALIQLRKQHPALYTLIRSQLHVEVKPENNILLLHRWHESEYVICLMNFSKEEHTIALPVSAPQWYKIFDSADFQWKGRSAAPSKVCITKSEKTSISIQPESILLYSNTHV